MQAAIALLRGQGAALVIVSAAVVAFTLALAIGSAEASGDEYGDSSGSSGGIDGDPLDVLGAPDGTIVQVGTVASAGVGELTVSFDNNVAFDGVGDDVLVHIVDTDFPATATIAVSADGATFIPAGDFPDTANVAIDLGALGLDYAVAVRITNVTVDPALLPGFDVDAVEALNQIDLDDLVLSATPETDENPGLTDHTVTANLTDATVAVVGARVSFEVTAGPNLGDDNDEDDAVTDAAGNVAFTYTGDGGPGTDDITVWLDINGNGVADGSEPVVVVTKLWNGVTGTIDLTDVDGGGVVVGDLLLIAVDDPDLDVTDAPDSVDVLVVSDSDPVGFLLTLTETGDHTGVFQGVLKLADATNAGAEELEAASGDVVTATYDDELDDEGNGPTPRIATLDVGDTEEEGLKVTICHYPGGNPGNARTLTIGSDAVEAHLANHGDDLGECGDDLPASKQMHQLTSFCERNPDHRRCEGFESSSAEAGANLELTDGAEDGDSKLAAFCERKPDHSRCGEVESGAASGSNLGTGEAAGDDAQLAAFCERKPDHKRCDGIAE